MFNDMIKKIKNHICYNCRSLNPTIHFFSSVRSDRFYNWLFFVLVSVVAETEEIQALLRGNGIEVQTVSQVQPIRIMSARILSHIYVKLGKDCLLVTLPQMSLTPDATYLHNFLYIILNASQCVWAYLLAHLWHFVICCVHPQHFTHLKFIFAGNCRRLNLTGRPYRHIGVLGTSKFYEIRNRTYTFTPQVNIHFEHYKIKGLS